MKKQQKGVRIFFLTALVFAVLSAVSGCKHPAKDGGSSIEQITVTVNKDIHVTKAPQSFKLDKGVKLGFTDLKKKMPDLSFSSGWQLSKICLNSASGAEITDTGKHTFAEDTVIFIVSKKEGSEEDVKLTELKIDGSAVTVAQNMDLGKTAKEKVSVECKASPGDAVISFSPDLDKGYWNLGSEKGKKSLTITVTKQSKSAVYNVSIEKIEQGTPVITKISVGGQIKEGAQIASQMEFTAAHGAADVSVAVETEPAGAAVAFTPDLTGGKLTLSGSETSLKIVVGTDPKKSEYTVKVKKLSNPAAFFGMLAVSGGVKQGISSNVSDEQINKILAAEDVVVELAGPNAKIIVGSKTKTWKSFKVNGQDVEFFPAAMYGFASLSIADIKLSKKDEITDVKIEAGDESGDQAELNFKIRRLNETVDVPADRLIIRDKNVITKMTVLKALADGSMPEFDGSEPANIEIQCTEDAVKSVTIDGSVCGIKTKTDQYDKEVWYAEKSVTGVKPAGKDITVTIEPKDTETYNSVTWTFKLLYKPPVVMGVGYEINGKDEYALEESFVEGLANGSNPSIQIEGSFLNIKLTCGAKVANVVINSETIDGDNLTTVGAEYHLLHSLQLETSEKQINITVNPLDTGAYSPKTFKFKAAGNGAMEAIEPQFEEISGDRNLPKAGFIDKLSTGDKPLYQTFGEYARLLISISSYEYEFLCKEVKINGEKIVLQKEGGGFFAATYKIKKDIPVNTSAPVDVRVEFIAQDGKANNITWEFKVQGGGSKPSIPQGKVTRFMINGAGNFSNPLPKDLTEHLTDGTNPIYEFDGKEALVEVGCYDPNLIEKVVFKMDGAQKAEVIPTKKGYAHVSEYNFKFTDTDAHPVELVIYPKDAAYSELIYTFKLKSSGKKAPPPLIFGINGQVRKSGYKGVLATETANILVQAKSDVMLEVKIGEKDKDEQVCNIEEFPASAGGNKFWEAKREVSLLDSDGNAVEKIFVIRVKPKDEETYGEAVCEYILKGTKILNNNAEFAVTPRKLPDVRSKVTWKAGFEDNEYIDDYGAVAVILEARTLSPRASVKCQIVDIADNPISGQSEMTMTNVNGVHTSPEITLFDDKPTKIKAWVVAEDGVTTDSVKGVWNMTYNPIPLFWDYTDKAAGADYTVKAYDTVEINKAAVGTDKKIYLVFAPWKETDGYTVDNTGLPAHQTAFVKMGPLGTYQEFYKTSIDVSTLVDSTETELEAVLKMKRNGKDCVTYKVKIKLAP